MTLRILFMYAYGLAQLYVVCLRRTVTPSAVVYLFLAGALFCLPIAYLAQSLLSYYVSPSPTKQVIHAAVEEIVKILPLAYLFFRTRVGAYAGLLDGVLCGAALGAGFGFAEDAIYAIENAALMAPYPSWGGILFSWLPGGWPRSGAFFPGHAVLGALAGAGIAAARRLVLPLALRILVGAAAVAWAVLLHAAFNTPQALWPWMLAYVFGWLNGSGLYAKYYVTALVIVFLVIEERAQARWAGAQGFAPSVRPAPLLAGLSAWIGELARAGWMASLQSARVLRLKRELFNLETSGWSAAPLARQARRIEEEASARPEPPRPWAGALHRMRGAVTLRPFGDFIYFWLLLVVMAMGFYLVFVSPHIPHARAQQFGRTTTFLVIGVLGQALVAWRCIEFLLRRRAPAGMGTDAGVKHVARYLLAWGGLAANAMAWKTLYDYRALPYPFRHADVEATMNQFRACYGPTPASASTGPVTSPIPPLIHDRNPAPAPVRQPQPEPEPETEASDPGLAGDDAAASDKPPAKPIRVGGLDEDFGGGDEPARPPEPADDRGLPLPERPRRPLPGGPLGDPDDLAGSTPR